MSTERELTEQEVMTAQQIIAKFRTADKDTRIAMARVGFELETQSTEGLTYEDCQGEVDTDSMWERANEEAREIESDVDLFLGHIDSYLIDLFNDKNTSKKIQLLKAMEITNLKEMCDAGLTTRDYDRLSEMISRSCYEDLDSDDYRSGTDLDDKVCVPYNMEVVQDSSVSGFEFRTMGGLTLNDATHAAVQIFQYEHDIDHKCSFHVHLSVLGVKHTWGGKLQAAMVEYLLTNIDKVPASVRHRWAKTQDYFKPKISRDKYSFVHMHSQGTWEFRCFGNVKNSDDARVCMELAMEALQHGYKVLNNDVILLKDFAELGEEDFYELCLKSMFHKKSLAEVIDSHMNTALQAA